ncbi:MAG: hypothetical protein KC588_07935 [Nitrospira sp.]|nr:hypothetical protein [Nitrospira sp.]
MKLNVVFNVAVILGMVAINSSAWGHSPNDAGEGGLQSKVREASLILYGQVVDLQYRNSEPTKEQPQGLPHTFVTYQVLEVLRGEVPDKKVILRIPGGADGQGGVYMVSTAPVFALGQTDVVFVKGGEIDDCQLVECVEGRFRIHENQVLNGWGVPVVEAHKTLRVGGKPRFDLNVMELPRPSFKALLERPEIKAYIDQVSRESRQTLKDLQARYDREAPKVTTVKLGNQVLPIQKDVTEEPEADPMEVYEDPLTPEAFFDAIREWSKQVGDPRSPIVMANVKERFEVPDQEVLVLETKDAVSLKISDEERYDIHAKEGLR